MANSTKYRGIKGALVGIPKGIRIALQPYIHQLTSGPKPEEKKQ